MAQAKNSGRKSGGMSKVRKTRPVPVLPDGAHGTSAAYLAKKACEAADALDAGQRAETSAAEARSAEAKRQFQAAEKADAEALRLECVADRSCRRCPAVLPPDAFERNPRARTGRSPYCRPCADVVRNRRMASEARLAEKKRKGQLFAPKTCRCCLGLFAPPHHLVAYCSEPCRLKYRREKGNETRRRHYPRTKGAEMAYTRASRAAHPERFNAYMREYNQRRQTAACAKEQYAEVGFFFLIRAASGFWRAGSPGTPIGRTEQIMAWYEWLEEDGAGYWCVLAPGVAGPTQRQIAARLARSERKSAGMKETA